MAVDYKSIEFRLHEYLVQIQEMLSLMDADQALLQLISEDKERIKSKKYNIAVMGEFKKGKSSLINALLGSKILPADVTPTTATINRITYGVNPAVQIHYKNGKSEEIDISELSEYVTKLTPGGQTRAMQIQEAVILFPTVICQNHVDIIDTPGLNDDEAMTKITIDMLNFVDGVILAVSARTPFSDTEAKFVCQLIKSSAIHSIVFTITFLDQLEEDEYEYDTLLASIKKRIREKVLERLEQDSADEEILGKAQRILSDLHIYGISAKYALNAFISNDRKLLKTSRFEEFKTGLLKIITANQVENATQKTVDHIRFVLSQLEGQYQIGVQKLNSGLQKYRQHSSEIYAYCDSCKKAVNDIMAKSYDELTAAINHTYILKNMLVSEFIKRLSAVKSNTHSEIKSAVTSATMDCYERINRENGPKIQQELYALLENDIHTFEQYRSAFIENLAQLGLEQSSFSLSDLSDSLMKFTKTCLENVQFKWQIPTVPNVADLSHCNVIEPIQKAVDVSINQYHDNLNACMAEIRRQWFALITEEADAVRSAVTRAEAALNEEIAIRVRAYTSNFQTLSQNANEIRKNSDAILQEFYSGSADRKL